MKTLIRSILSGCVLAGAAAASTSWIPPVGKNLCASDLPLHYPFTVREIQQTPAVSGTGSIVIVVAEYPKSPFRYTYNATSETETLQANAILSMALTAKSTTGRLDLFLPSITCGGPIQGVEYAFTNVELVQ
jgi:hypothetical protein